MYQAAIPSRFRRVRTGYNPLGSGADYHYRYQQDWLKILEDCRDMDRNDVIIGQTVDPAVANEIQDGFTLTPMTGDPKLDKDLAARWKDWAEDADQCDLTGERGFSGPGAGGQPPSTLTATSLPWPANRWRWKWSKPIACGRQAEDQEHRARR